MDRKWYYAFIKWHEENGYSRSYTGKHVKDLKCLMRYAYEEGVHQNDEYRKKYFTKPKDNRKKEPLSRSEIQQITPDKVFEDEYGKFLGIKQQKTKNFIQVPINSEADRILSKYGYQFPNLCEQAINRDLKVVAELAGIEKTRAKKLSLHISRHSFCRLAYQVGIPSYHIMKIFGHRTERSFLQYINITSGEAMEEFRKHEYFQ